MHYKDTKDGSKLYMGKWDTDEFEHVYALLRYAEKQMEKHECTWVYGKSKIANARDIKNALEVLKMFKDNHSVNIN